MRSSQPFFVGLVGGAALVAFVACGAFSAAPTDNIAPADAGDDASKANGADGGDGSAGPCTSSEQNFTSDAKNCGACGHDCLGGQCASGRCKSLKLANLDRPFSLAVDDDSIFVTSQDGADGVTRVSLSDPPTKTILAQESATAVAFDATRVYFCNQSTEEIVRVDKNGKDKAVVVDTTKCPELAHDKGQLFFTQPDANEVTAVNITDGVVSSVLNLSSLVDNGKPEGIAIDSDTDTVFYSVLMGKRIESVPRAGGASPTKLVAATGDSPRRIKIDAAHVYYTEVGTASIHRLAKNGADLQEVGVGPDVTGIGGLAVDDDFVYWVSTSAGALLRAPKDGSKLNGEVILDGLAIPIDVGIDAHALYVVENGGKPQTGALHRLAKPLKSP